MLQSSSSSPKPMTAARRLWGAGLAVSVASSSNVLDSWPVAPEPAEEWRSRFLLAPDEPATWASHSSRAARTSSSSRSASATASSVSLCSSQPGRLLVITTNLGVGLIRH